MLFLFQTNMNFLIKIRANLASTKLSLFFNKGLIKQKLIPQFGINKKNKVPAYFHQTSLIKNKSPELPCRLPYLP